MKRLLIVSHALELGGAERALLGLLHALDRPDVRVDLFLLRHEGELLPELPAHVHLLPELPAYTVLARPMQTVLREGHVLLTAARLWGKWKAAWFTRRHRLNDSAVALEYSHKYTCPFMPDIQPDVEYDLAISFLTPHYMVLENVRAKKKLAWIHTDYAEIGIDVRSEEAMWGRYDRIVSISDRVSAGFVQVFPALADKLMLMENIHIPERIRQNALAADVLPEMPAGPIRLLSVGRFCTAKNFDHVPEICACIRAQGLDIRWYLIGYGGDEGLIRRKIREAGMQEYVILLGKKENPYPYISACDLYVQPSRYEGNCVTVHEAQILGKPVVITAYATAASQLENGVDGVVVPMAPQGCADGIAALLRDPARMQALADTCRQRDYSNRGEVEKIYRLL